MRTTECLICLLASAMTLAKTFWVLQIRTGQLGGRGSQVDTATAPEMNISAPISEYFRQSHRPLLIFYYKLSITKSTPLSNWMLDFISKCRWLWLQSVPNALLVNVSNVYYKSFLMHITKSHSEPLANVSWLLLQVFSNEHCKVEKKSQDLFGKVIAQV